MTQKRKGLQLGTLLLFASLFPFAKAHVALAAVHCNIASDWTQSGTCTIDPASLDANLAVDGNFQQRIPNAGAIFFSPVLGSPVQAIHFIGSVGADGGDVLHMVSGGGLSPFTITINKDVVLQSMAANRGSFVLNIFGFSDNQSASSLDLNLTINNQGLLSSLGDSAIVALNPLHFNANNTGVIAITGTGQGVFDVENPADSSLPSVSTAILVAPAWNIKNSPALTGMIMNTGTIQGKGVVGTMGVVLDGNGLDPNGLDQKFVGTTDKKLMDNRFTLRNTGTIDATIGIFSASGGIVDNAGFVGATTPSFVQFKNGGLVSDALLASTQLNLGSHAAPGDKITAAVMDFGIMTSGKLVSQFSLTNQKGGVIDASNQDTNVIHVAVFSASRQIHIRQDGLMAGDLVLSNFESTVNHINDPNLNATSAKLDPYQQVEIDFSGSPQDFAFDKLSLLGGLAGNISIDENDDQVGEGERFAHQNINLGAGSGVITGVIAANTANVNDACGGTWILQGNSPSFGGHGLYASSRATVENAKLYVAKSSTLLVFGTNEDGANGAAISFNNDAHIGSLTHMIHIGDGATLVTAGSVVDHGLGNAASISPHGARQTDAYVAHGGRWVALAMQHSDAFQAPVTVDGALFLAPGLTIGQPNAPEPHTKDITVGNQGSLSFIGVDLTSGLSTQSSRYLFSAMGASGLRAFEAAGQESFAVQASVRLNGGEISFAPGSSAVFSIDGRNPALVISNGATLDMTQVAPWDIRFLVNDRVHQQGAPLVEVGQSYVVVDNTHGGSLLMGAALADHQPVVQKDLWRTLAYTYDEKGLSATEISRNFAAQSPYLLHGATGNLARFGSHFSRVYENTLLAPVLFNAHTRQQEQSALAHDAYTHFFDQMDAATNMHDLYLLQARAVSPELYIDMMQEGYAAATRFGTDILESMEQVRQKCDLERTGFCSWSNIKYNYSYRDFMDNIVNSKSSALGGNVAIMQKFNPNLHLGGAFQYLYVGTKLSDLDSRDNANSLQMAFLDDYEQLSGLSILHHGNDRVHIRGAVQYAFAYHMMTRHAQYGDSHHDFETRALQQTLLGSQEAGYVFGVTDDPLGIGGHLEIEPFARVDAGMTHMAAIKEDGYGSASFPNAIETNDKTFFVGSLFLGFHNYFTMPLEDGEEAVKLTASIAYAADFNPDRALKTYVMTYDAYGNGTQEGYTYAGLSSPGWAGVMWGFGAQYTQEEVSARINYDGRYGKWGQIDSTFSAGVNLGF